MRVHFIGIKGVSMEFLACLCKKEGASISGSDLNLSGHDAKNVIGADVVVYSSAISTDNVEYVEAKRRNIPLLSRAELLGKLSSTYKSVVAISGTHGKTTTAAMLSETLKYLNPTCHVGGAVKGAIGSVGGKELFITEACEYKESFLSLAPDYAIVLNVELDHADYYKTYDNFYAAFNKFGLLSRVAFVCGDNQARTIKGREKTYTFGINKDNDYYAQIEGETNGYYSFSAFYKGTRFAFVTLKVRGVHNVTNAMAALAYCHHTGAKCDGITDFCGVDRRFESLGIIGGVEYISDYAHHPHEIECSLKLAKRIHSRVLTVFEPHTYTRTAKFYREFASALSMSDACILLPVFAAREQPVCGVSSALIANAGGFEEAGSYAQAKDMIRQKAKEFDCVIFMGAGTVGDFARKYIKDI